MRFDIDFWLAVWVGLILVLVGMIIGYFLGG